MMSVHQFPNKKGARVADIIQVRYVFAGSDVVNGRVLMRLVIENPDGTSSCPFCHMQIDVSEMNQESAARIMKDGITLRGSP